MKLKFNDNSGFTMIELIVVISIIGILTTLAVGTFNDLRAVYRDSARVSDVSQLQVALAAYKRDNGTYPGAITAGQSIVGGANASTTVYMIKAPTPPTPQDGSCGSYPVYASYYYLPSANLKDYCLFFCLGDNTSSVTAGAKYARPYGVYSTSYGSITCP